MNKNFPALSPRSVPLLAVLVYAVVSCVVMPLHVLHEHALFSSCETGVEHFRESHLQGHDHDHGCGHYPETPEDHEDHCHAAFDHYPVARSQDTPTFVSFLCVLPESFSGVDASGRPDSPPSLLLPREVVVDPPLFPRPPPVL